jgi:glyoxalase family protein
VTNGIHHITAIAGDPQANVDFYAGLLGLRLIKRTVNFDDPGTWHLYYGDEQGSPGTVLTFFPWGKAAGSGRVGPGQATAVSFAAPPAALDFWDKRLAGRSPRPYEAGGERGLELADPDGIRVRIVAVDGDPRTGHGSAGVPRELSLRGFHAVELRVRDEGPTAALLAGSLGCREAGRDDRRLRLEAGNGGTGTYVDLVRDREAPTGAHGRWRGTPRSVPHRR